MRKRKIYWQGLSFPGHSLRQALEEAFEEPGAFTVEHDGSEVTLTTKRGTEIILTVHAVSVPAEQSPVV